jgi:iron(III) transport system substrate-binding protein
VLQNFLHTAKVQQLMVNEGGLRSVHPDVKEPAGRTPLSQIKMLPDDPVAMLPQIAEIKKRYTALFGN